MTVRTNPIDATATGVRPGEDIRYAFTIPNFGDFAEPRVFARCAQAVEAAGWDGLLTWDALVGEKWRHSRIADPWILLAAAGMVTTRIRFGTAVTPLPRRRIHKLAKEITTLDHLTEGRMILGVGSGDPIPDEYGAFGEPTSRATLAAILDESLDALDLIVTGKPVTYHGRHITIDDIDFPYTPIQRPRIPIWVGGDWKNPHVMARIARCDGALPAPGFRLPAPRTVRTWRHRIDEIRSATTQSVPIDLVLGGPTDLDRAADIVGPLAEAGVTWWNEAMPYNSTLENADATLRRIEQGPPRP
ncbi:LLM class flavin-dependent oxidoreductase [Nocardia arthritidis]|uniref:LLM class flavin-dependent oxidoreductase n=1 Tax=Nocardia arthritidis TaxID=228602 RepID=A0A6G9YLW8_9NOCA|nr:LLM class flavin-dependent oxidoreductase [Nocardia arthritidis]QIS14192.1 LLM class flavin-dependent oxidoreductase [Nocardia arthritidis]